MADYSCEYVLTSAGGTITFNDGILGHGSRDDLYWIDTIHGLDGPELRVPIDQVAFGDGGLIHRSWKGPRHPAPEGRIIVQSVSLAGCQARLNEMEEAFHAVLDQMLAPDVGSLTWTPTGSTERTLAVYYERTLDIQPADGYRTRSFDFGLFSPSADF